MTHQPSGATITFVLNVPGWYHRKIICASLLMLIVILFEDDILLVRDD